MVEAKGKLYIHRVTGVVCLELRIQRLYGVMVGFIFCLV